MIKKLLILAISIISIQASALEIEIFKNATVNICGQRSLGCAHSVTLEDGRRLLLDRDYAGSLVNVHANSNYDGDDDPIDYTKPTYIKTKEIMGVVVTESGHFPNPMADFEVIKVIKVIK